MNFRPHDAHATGFFDQNGRPLDVAFNGPDVPHFSHIASGSLQFGGFQSPMSPFDVDLTADSSIECHLRIMTSSPLMSHAMMRRQSIMSEAMAPSLSEGSSVVSPSSIPNTPTYSGAGHSFQSSVCASPKLADTDLWPHDFASDASVTFCPLPAEIPTMQNAMMQTPFTSMSTYMHSTMADQQSQDQLLPQQFSHPSNWTGDNHGADGLIQAISPADLQRLPPGSSCHGQRQHQSFMEPPAIQDEAFANPFALYGEANDMVHMGSTSGVAQGAANVSPETLLQSIPTEISSSGYYVPFDHGRPKRGRLTQHKTPRSMHGCPKCDYKCRRKEHLSRHTLTKHDYHKAGFCYASVCIDRDPGSPTFGGPKCFSRKDNSRDHVAGHLHLDKEHYDDDGDGDSTGAAKRRAKRKAKKRSQEVHPDVLFREIRKGLGPEREAEANEEIAYLIRRAQFAADKPPVIRQWLGDNGFEKDLPKPVKKGKRGTPDEDFSPV